MLVENVNYNINWGNFRVGTSFFIPCLDGKEARRVVKRTTKRFKIPIVTKVTIESGIRGLRVWRIKK